MEMEEKKQNYGDDGNIVANELVESEDWITRAKSGMGTVMASLINEDILAPETKERCLEILADCHALLAVLDHYVSDLKKLFVNNEES